MNTTALLISFAVLGAATFGGFLYHRHVLEGPRSPMAVVNRRTFFKVKALVNDAVDNGDIWRARVGYSNMIAWLRSEIDHGPARHVDEYARELEITVASHRQVLTAYGRDTDR